MYKSIWQFLMTPVFVLLYLIGKLIELTMPQGYMVTIQVAELSEETLEELLAQLEELEDDE